MKKNYILIFEFAYTADMKIKSKRILSDLQKMSGTRNKIRRAWLNLIKRLNLKAFVQVAVSKDVQTAYQVMATCAGLGGLDTNTIVVPLYKSAHRRQKLGVCFVLINTFRLMYLYTL